MNGKEKEMVHQKKWAFCWFLKLWRVSDDQIVAGSLFQDTQEDQKPDQGWWKMRKWFWKRKWQCMWWSFVNLLFISSLWCTVCNGGWFWLIGWATLSESTSFMTRSSCCQKSQDITHSRLYAFLCFICFLQPVHWSMMNEHLLQNSLSQNVFSVFCFYYFVFTSYFSRPCHLLTALKHCNFGI